MMKTIGVTEKFQSWSSRMFEVFNVEESTGEANLHFMLALTQLGSVTPGSSAARDPLKSSRPEKTGSR